MRLFTGDGLTTELRDQLQATLGSAYALDRELGGGGMSRVFAAREVALDRMVVVKVLSPELSAGISVDRFRREIQLAAQLQHPHIVPVLAAGETQGLPYYTMPLVEGDSLRARLAAAGALPMSDVLSILRDVARALAYAHARGVVHRDIKPDNILLSGGAAVVTDFGVAKALSSARGGAAQPTLTGLGTSLGTPAYMAPEQAAADPGTDRRADLYSFGATAYEMLCGQPPFAGRSPQRMLAAQMSERPEPIEQLRADTPPALAALVMQCLEKEPAARPATAEEVLRTVEAVTSTGGHSAAPVIALASRRMLGRALAIYAGAFIVVAVLARAAIIAIGLPDWVFPGSLIVMALGLPVILFTGLVHHQSRIAKTQATRTPGGTAVQYSTMARLAVKASPWVSWRRTAMGGVYAVGSFVVVIGLYMLLRALGIGPEGSLMAAGALGIRERIILTDFQSPAADTTLGTVVTEAFRAQLSQSANLSLVQPATVRDVLRRMQRPPTSRLDLALAREIATREGIKAIIDGEVIAVGGSYVIAARLIAASTGEPLASYQAGADQARDILPAIDKVSRKLRAKTGESLRHIQAALPLEQVTTGSLDALRKYVQANRVLDTQGDMARFQSLMEEALTIDSGFAMAYRRLAVVLNNRGGQRAKVWDLLQKAYDHRDRLSDAERYLAVGSYFQSGPKPDATKSIAAYEALLELQPDNTVAMNNAGLIYSGQRDYAKSSALYRRAMELNPASIIYRSNYAEEQVNAGNWAEATRTIDKAVADFPDNPIPTYYRASFASARGQYDSAAALMDSLRKARASDENTRAGTSFTLASLAEVRGRVGEARRLTREAHAAEVSGGATRAMLTGELDDAALGLWYLSDTVRALKAVESALAKYPLDRLAPIERPYGTLTFLYSLAGRPDRAKLMLEGYEASRSGGYTLRDNLVLHEMRGTIAMAERRYADALQEYRQSDGGECMPCALPNIGRAYDLSGNADSAIAVFARYLTTPSLDRINNTDPQYLAGVHKRLGELYEARGDNVRAAEEYGRFIELWKDADPALQPRVADARRRLERIRAAEPR